VQKKSEDVHRVFFTEEWKWVRWVSDCRQLAKKSLEDIPLERTELLAAVVSGVFLVSSKPLL